ncbi:response regulator receiver protein [Desulfovibrio sp. X2]|uniref:response regulator n=1 Tax=Desulfovibrio sp. X2 TaxID=941449 RepID=UPI000358B3D4|nr:response regulator [Desulfovibrio sp. X2]EPR41585.1 response regulator receiver protein [Desulfovibrio sp. X2]
MDKLRYLVVDDEDRFRQSLIRLLEAKGMRAEGASDGRAALRALEQKPYDVILLDVKMPGMDGVQALPRIRELAPQAEVIVLTGHASVDDAALLMERGASEYLVKPCGVNEILDTVAVLRDRRAMTAQSGA